MLTFESRTSDLKEMTLQYLSYSTHELEKLGSLMIWYCMVVVMVYICGVEKRKEAAAS